jgi:hypothetical protein
LAKGRAPAAGRGDAAASAHHAEYPNLVGLRAGYVGLTEADEQKEYAFRSAVYLGVSCERVLIHEVLEAEVAVPVVVSSAPHGGLSMPIDVHLKVPFHPIRQWTPILLQVSQSISSLRSG